MVKRARKEKNAFVCNGRFVYHYSLALEFVKTRDMASKVQQTNSEKMILFKVERIWNFKQQE